MSEQNTPLLQKVPYEIMEMELNFADGYDSGATGIHQSRYNIPVGYDYGVFSSGVGTNPLVGTGASISTGTDNVSSDPDNMLDTTALTSLDANHDTIEGGFDGSFSTLTKNTSTEPLPVYYNITTAAITDGKLKQRIVLIPSIT